MGILTSERERVKKEALLLSRAGAQRYAQKLEAALNVLHDFDDKCTDDIKGLRQSFENTGVVTCLVTTQQGYSALVSSDGVVLATALPEDEPSESEVQEYDFDREYSVREICSVSGVYYASLIGRPEGVIHDLYTKNIGFYPPKNPVEWVELKPISLGDTEPCN